MGEFRKIPHPKWVTALFWVAFVSLCGVMGLAFGLALQEPR
jgi:hypothetical protein